MGLLRPVVVLVGLLALSLPTLSAAPGPRSVPRKPNVLIVTVDTLRADRLSSAGYRRPTSPHMDRVIREGVNFARARTVEPLTNPALSSMLTSLAPNRHGATRNGLRIRPGLASLPKVLRANGYRTAAFVGSWTLRRKLSGLDEHFDTYEEVLTRARWFGLVRSEATGEDLTERSVDWIERHVAGSGGQPFLAWVHFVEPHAPYVAQKDFLHVLGTARKRDLNRHDRYDTEVAFVDAAIGDLLDRVAEHSPPRNTLVVLTSDHGESMGEHDYWGHGRHLYEPTLRIPMALHWSGRLEPTTIDAPALNTDLAPTVLRLLGLPVPETFEGYDWTAVLDGAPAPEQRITRHEAHKGAVISRHRSELARRSGLLEVAVIHDERKELLSLKKNRRYVFDLRADPGELVALEQVPGPTAALEEWVAAVRAGLESLDEALPEPLDDESVAALRSLGYVD